MDHPTVHSSELQDESPRALADAECPHCGTMLRKVTTASDGHVLCLNCGKRHLPRSSNPANPLDLEAETAPREESEVLPQAREPVAPAYGYLRALGILGLVAGVIGSIFAFFGISQSVGMRYFSWSSGYVWLFQNAFTPAIAGWSLFALTEALVRLDTVHTAIAWRSGYLKESILAPKGSSLPYILPLAATGGALGFSIAFANADSQGNVEFILLVIGFVLIGAFMAAGFALENLRLFFLRQREIAHLAALEAHGAPLPKPSDAMAWSGSALWMVGMVSFLSIGMLAILFESRMDGHEALMMVLGILGMAGIGYSLMLVLGGLAAAREQWECAAWTTPRPKPDLLVQAGTGIPFLWIGIGTVFFLAVLVSEGHLRAVEFFILFGFSGGFVCLAMLFSTLLRAVRSWRASQRKVLNGTTEHGWPGGRARMLLLVLLLLAAANLFAGGVTEANAFGSWGRWYSVSDRVARISAMTLFVLATAFIPLWLACMIREARLSLEVAEDELARKKAEANAVYPPPEI